MSVLMEASHQWSSRPADERYASLEDLHTACEHAKNAATEFPGVDIRFLRAAVQEVGFAEDPLPVLEAGNGNPIRFTHYSFGQFSRKLGAPAHYLRTLSPSLAVANLNYGISHLSDDAATNNNMLVATNGATQLRCITSDKYTRIWNADITSRLLRLREMYPNLQPAPAAFDGSRGLYASDHDMFAFMVDNDRRIFERSPGGGLSRGFFVSNSEVGDASFAISTFMYQYICGNHIVWGAENVNQLRIRHIGNADERAFAQWSVELRKYTEASSAADEALIERAAVRVVGGTKDEILDAVMGLGIPDISRKVVADGLVVAEEHAEWYGGNPRTVWAVVGGITEVARDIPHADDRARLDRAAGKVLARLAA